MYKLLTSLVRISAFFSLRAVDVEPTQLLQKLSLKFEGVLSSRTLYVFSTFEVFGQNYYSYFLVTDIT